MGFNRFSILLTARLLLLFVALLAVGWLMFIPGYHAATLLATLMTLAIAWDVYRFVLRTNLELSRFLDAARYADFGQRFQFGTTGAGFDALASTFTDIMDRFREDRQQQETELRHMKALLEHVPVPLISIYHDGRVVLWNNAARRLFGNAHISSASDLAQFGDDLAKQVTTIRAGERALTTFRLDGQEQRMAVSASELTIASGVERLISLMNIQSELDGMQLSAWQDLVRVLTHEIMNSITPVASLAKTAVDLVDDASVRVTDPAVVEELQDARDAVDTVARRSDGLMNFVSSYRELTRPREPEKSRFEVRALFRDVEQVTSQGLPDSISLSTEVEPESLHLLADKPLIEQVLINLVKNSQQALEGAADGRIGIKARLNQRGHVVIDIEDNGPGIADDVVGRIFVPFYTTRREGSGVGLALSRQIMIAHGGNLSYSNRPDGGARFTMIF